MITLGVGDCSVTKGQHRKAVVLGGLWSYGTAIARAGICTQNAVGECMAMFRQQSEDGLLNQP